MAGSNSLIKTALEQHVRRLTELDEEEPFFVCDLDHVRQSCKTWSSLMPKIRPFYAVKCNPDPILLRKLADFGGVGFDCASPSEMDVVLGLGVDPTSIIYAHPCKGRSCIRYALDRGVQRMTFDNTMELQKIATEYPSANLILRILADDETAVCRLGKKFGASLSESRQLLILAKSLGLKVIGISFHVGSGARDASAFRSAIRDARRLWNDACNLSFNMHVLDIGGGFTQKSFKEMASSINEAIEEHFGGLECELIAEPGRYFAESAYTLACTVIAQRTSISGLFPGAPSVAMLYLNDGVYGSFAQCVYEKAVFSPDILRQSMEYFPDKRQEQEVQVVLWGPTCDSEDVINTACSLRSMPSVGDWLYFENMGAYSLSCLTAFNGFSSVRHTIHVTSENEHERKDSGLVLGD